MSNDIDDLELLARELKGRLAERSAAPGRWNANPEDVQRSVAQLVLTLVDFIRKLLERQAIRRMEGGTLSEQQIEDVGRALWEQEYLCSWNAAILGAFYALEMANVRSEARICEIAAIDAPVHRAWDLGVVQYASNPDKFSLPRAGRGRSLGRIAWG